MKRAEPPGKPTAPLIEQWGRIQESLAQITGLSFTTLGPRGKLLAEAGETPLCRLLSAHPEGEKRCRDSCRSQADQARRDNRTRFFRCQAGLLCFATPIRVEGRVVATVLGGHILEKAPDSSFFQGLAGELGLPEDRVLKAVGELPLDTSRSLTRVAELVEQTSEVLFASAFHSSRAQHQLGLLSSLFQLGTDLSPEKDPHEIHALIVNTVSILFDVQGACLMLHQAEGGLFRVKTAFGIAEQCCLDLELRGDGGIVGEVVDGRLPLATEDYHQVLRSGFPEQIRSVALFPLLFGEAVKGLLLILNTKLDKEAVSLIFSFCNQASTAIQNTILRQELKDKMEEAARLTRIQNRITPILDRDSLLEAIFDEATRMTRAEQASLMLLNRKTNELIVRLASGGHSPVIRKVTLGPGEGIAGKVAQRGRPLLVSDLEKDSRFRRKPRPRYRSNSFLIIPLMVGSRVIGVINLADKSDGVFTSEDLGSLQAVLSQASIALQRSELYAMTRELQKISTTDPLTKLLNRRYFQRRSSEEILRAQRFKLPLSLVMLDLDDFKSYNDRHGHPAGDKLLVGVSRRIRESVRSIDVVSRIGGEEFAVLSPQTGRDEALTVAERIREAVCTQPFPFEEKQPLGTISISGGVATYPDQAGSLQELLDNADRALYRAKGSGKNRIVSFAAG
jgi:diguanylate cyclase (GGDEF)-like protein